MIASVHIADVGARTTLAALRRAPTPATTPGLRSADTAIVVPLGQTFRRPPPLGRLGLVGFWDDDDALDQFLANHPLAATLAGGWQVRLVPLRAYGSWDGLPPPPAVPAGRSVDHDGPAVVVTLGRARLPRLVPFLRTSAKAERAVLGAPGLTWATGMARPPRFVATCSLWESTKALSTYAYGRAEPAHADAIAAHETDPFHHRSAFIRFRPYRSVGSLGGTNPLTSP